MKERALLFGHERLVGVVSDPEKPAVSPTVVIFNSGVVHRVGPGRLSVRLARRMCERGHRVARFDHAGIGDSAPRSDRSSWHEATVTEARVVMDALADAHGAERFILIGLCSGAATSFRTAIRDPRVVAAVLMNPQGFDDNPEWNMHVRNRGWARDYWTRSLRNPASWRRALTGRIGYGRLVRVLARSARARAFPSRRVAAVSQRLGDQLNGLLERGVRLLFLFTAEDHAEDYFDAIAKRRLGTLRDSGRLTIASIPNADHTFTLLANQAAVLENVLQWIASDQAPDSRQRTTGDHGSCRP